MVDKKLEGRICPKGQTEILIVRNGFPVSKETAEQLEKRGCRVFYVETPEEAKKESRKYAAIIYNTKAGIPFLKPDTNI